MKNLPLALLIALAAGLSGGCRIGRYVIEEPVTDRAVEVKSGDRICVELTSNATTGYTWTAETDDEEVEIGYEEIPPEAGGELYGASGKTRIIIRVHRGFAGPATVKMKYLRTWSDEVARTVTFLLHRRPSDVSWWK